jgi:hypothetical protein
LSLAGQPFKVVGPSQSFPPLFRLVR